MIFKDKKLFIMIKLTQEAFGKYKKRIVFLTFLGFLSASLEGIGVTAIIPLFSFVMKTPGGQDNAINLYLEKIFSFLHLDFKLSYLLIFISLLFILKTVFLLLSNYMKIKITSEYEEQMRGDLLRQTLNANWNFLLKQKAGYLDTVLINDVRAGSLLLQQITTINILAISLFAYIFVALNISVVITLATLLLGGVLSLVFKPLVRKTRETAHETNLISKQVAYHANETISGMKAIKSMAVEKEVSTEVKTFFASLKRLRIKIFVLSNISSALIQPISLMFICGVFLLSYNNPNFSFASLIAVVYLIQRIFLYVQQVQSSLHSVNEGIPYLKNIMEYRAKAFQYKEINQGDTPVHFNDTLQFNHVHFGYKSKGNVLEDLNFSIKQGEMVGLIGSSGSGKTTVVDLMLRLFEPQSGSIDIDGKNISTIELSQWRKNIGYVSQDIFIINDTIANNIRFYNEDILDADIEIAAKKANVYDFIMSCPEKFDTRTGERGVMLSTGQRQRIVLSRILARNPKFLILDEATSSLDNESEKLIQNMIQDLRGQVTVFAVAHRLTTVLSFDKIIVLEKGKIVEEGKPSELLQNQNSYFYKMFQLGNQLQTEEVK